MTPERWREVDSVVRGALAQPPDARPAFVANACSSDERLRREVEELLAVRTGDFLARPAAATFAAAEDAAMYARVSAALAGRYELERELGRGGMATVYLARDLRHDRPVAVKVLHAELAAVVGGARFLTEIRTTAALQHPHILPLFDSGSAENDRLLYYVMPYVAGETLRGRLMRERQLPVADALRIATEVASALEYAHRHGVIHRDIKPENILLAEDGQALIADFGIALAISHAAGERLTQSGLSLGTPQYMAPEQAAGERSIDARADVYALGAVTYEMLAGEPPFTGPSAQAILARLMTDSPRALAAQRPSVAHNVDAAVRSALEKLPADRFPTASAFAAALVTPQLEIGRPMRATTPRRWRSLLAGLTIALLALVAALRWSAGGWGAAPAARARAADGATIRFTIQLDSGFLDFFSDPALSPDGRTIVYAAGGPDGVQLYARSLDQLAARPLPFTADGNHPFFSPNGEWVAFFRHGELRRTRLDGGASLVVTTMPLTAEAIWACAWGRDDAIICAAIDVPSPMLVSVPASGGSVSRIPLADTTASIIDPHPLPRGNAVLVTVTDGPLPSTRVGLLDRKTGRVRPLGVGRGARYVGGAIVYASGDGDLLRQPFDLDQVAPTGPPELVTKDLETFNGGATGFDVSESGALVYFPTSGPTSGLTLLLTDRAGRTERMIAARAPWVPRFSPDGNLVAYGAGGPEQQNDDVWITDLVATTTQRLTTDDRDGNDPQWSPDQKTIAYSINALTGTGKRLVLRPLNGGAERALTRGPGSQWPSDWTPDGRSLFFTNNRGSAGSLIAVQEIWVQPVDGAPPQPYLTSPAHERGARISSDGHWVAYVSDETGRNEVYVQSYPKPGLKVLVSSGGGDNPVWRRDTRELYYWQGDQLFVVTFDADRAGEPLKMRNRLFLFRAPYVQAFHPNYDIAPDGRRFAIVTGNIRRNRLVVALNALSQGRPVAR